MVALRLAFLPILFVGCAGPRPGPPPPAPAEAGVAAHYEQAYAVLRTHPAVQAFAADHLDASQTLAISVSEDVVPLPYTLVANDMASSGARAASPERAAAVRDSLAALTEADRFAPETDPALPLLSMRQHRPLVLFFGKMQDGRLTAQLYPNPYRRRGFEAVRSDGPPGLAFLFVFEGGSVADVYTGAIMTE